MTLGLLDEAVENGARLEAATAILGISTRSIQRWRRAGSDRRSEPRERAPRNKLSADEIATVVRLASSVEYRDLSPNQIVPRLADEGEYVASESSFYRILRAKNLLAHRDAARPSIPRTPPRLRATAPNQVWSWDITYLLSRIRGVFFRLYMIEDIWSRKIVGWAVHETESTELAAKLFVETCEQLGVDPTGLALHADNGGPMKGSTMLATLQRLHVVASFSRPSVSDDNPFSEALFRTLKYRPEYPSKPFESIEDARRWVAEFVAWYNNTHLHSGIRFVTPEHRHSGADVALLARRSAVYQAAKERRPERWSRQTRNWSRIAVVELNPQSGEREQRC